MLTSSSVSEDDVELELSSVTSLCPEIVISKLDTITPDSKINTKRIKSSKYKQQPGASRSGKSGKVGKFPHFFSLKASFHTFLRFTLYLELDKYSWLHANEVRNVLNRS